MPWWVLMLIVSSIYITGFLVTGAVASRIFDPNNCDWREEVVSSMIFWPIALPGFLIYKGVTKYLNSLEDQRRRKSIRQRQVR